MTDDFKQKFCKIITEIQNQTEKILDDDLKLYEEDIKQKFNHVKNFSDIYDNLNEISPKITVQLIYELPDTEIGKIIEKMKKEICD
jgi:hypothetical protein